MLKLTGLLQEVHYWTHIFESLKKLRTTKHRVTLSIKLQDAGYIYLIVDGIAYLTNGTRCVTLMVASSYRQKFKMFFAHKEP